MALAGWSAIAALRHAAVGDVVWHSESGVKPNTLVRFDSRSQTFVQTWAIPSGGGVVRHMMATRDGNLVLACSGVNRVALVESGKRTFVSRRRHRLASDSLTPSRFAP